MRTGYPSWVNDEDDDEILDDEEDFDLGAYIDRIYEEERDRRLFGDEY